MWNITTAIYVAGNYGTAPSHSIDAISTGTILELKSQIQDKVGIPKDKLKLYFNDKQLDDAKTLEDYPRIKDGTTLYYSKKVDEKITIFVKKEFPRNDTVVMIRAKPSLTILELKQKIEKKRGFSMDEQRLFFSDIKLELDATLREYGIKEHDSILLRLENDPIKIQLMVEDCPHDIYFRIAPSTRMRNLKVRIESKLNIRITDQTLLFQGMPLDDESTFKTAGIKNGMVVILKFKKFRLRVVGVEGDMHFIVSLTTRVGRISSILAEYKGFRRGYVLFYYCGERLDNYTSLRENGVYPGTELQYMEGQSGSISNFTSKPSNNPLTAWLTLNDNERVRASAVATKKRDSLPLPYPSHEQLLAEIRKKNATLAESFQLSHSHSQSIISARDRTRLSEVRFAVMSLLFILFKTILLTIFVVVSSTTFALPSNDRC